MGSPPKFRLPLHPCSLPLPVAPLNLINKPSNSLSHCRSQSKKQADLLGRSSQPLLRPLLPQCSRLYARRHRALHQSNKALHLHSDLPNHHLALPSHPPLLLTRVLWLHRLCLSFNQELCLWFLMPLQLKKLQLRRLQLLHSNKLLQNKEGKQLLLSNKDKLLFVNSRDRRHEGRQPSRNNRDKLL